MRWQIPTMLCATCLLGHADLDCAAGELATEGEARAALESVLEADASTNLKRRATAALEAVQHTVATISRDDWIASFATAGNASPAIGYVRGDLGVVALDSDEVEPTSFRGFVVDGPARVRREPSVLSEKIGLVPVGTAIQIIRRVDDWYLIQHGDGLGYVYHQLIEAADAVALDATSSPRSSLFPEVQLGAGPNEIPLTNAIGHLSDAVAEERPEYGMAAFRCLREHQMCRAEFSWFDCDLTMIVCLAGVVVN